MEDDIEALGAHLAGLPSRVGKLADDSKSALRDLFRPGCNRTPGPVFWSPLFEGFVADEPHKVVRGKGQMSRFEACWCSRGR